MLTIFWCDQIPERFQTSNKHYYEDNKTKKKTNRENRPNDLFFASCEPKFMLILRDELFSVRAAFNYEHLSNAIKIFLYERTVWVWYVVVFYRTQWPTYQWPLFIGFWWCLLLAVCCFCHWNVGVWTAYVPSANKNNEEKNNKKTQMKKKNANSTREWWWYCIANNGISRICYMWFYYWFICASIMIS